MSDSGRRGRPPRPIDPASPAARFADDLRGLVGGAGLTYQRLAEETGYSKSTLSRALSGQQLPSWDIVERFLIAVGAGDRRTIATWKQRWTEISDPMAPVRADVRLDPTAPIFYLGYAHSNPGGPGSARSNSILQRLHHDLTGHLQELVGLMPGQEAGFVDLGIQGGEQWQAEAAVAIGTCQVYVPLISPAYLASRWCRFEWDGFAARAVRSRSGEPPMHTPIVPVVWTPLDLATVPPPIRDVQMFTPASAAPGVLESYLREGLYGILQLHQEREYEVIVWRLAQQIVNLTMRYYLEPQIPEATGLRSSFLDDDGR